MPQALAYVSRSKKLSSAPDRSEILVIAVAAVIFLGCAVSPPGLMDDVDSVNATIARNMLTSGDWVTGRLNGVLYVDKAPLNYWLMAASYAVFGVSDWASRIPLALAAIALCWVTARFGRWAFSARAGLYAGLSLASCVGLFLFTRVRIPDVALTLAVTAALWGLVRALEEDEPQRRRWALVLGGSLGLGVLLKGMIALAIPAGAGMLYLLVTRQLFSRRAWKRLHWLWASGAFLLIAAPWHLLAVLRNPPYFDFTMVSGPGQYRGFFWRYFINEHLLRYLGARFPRDYNTVPLGQFWLSQFLWMFPWSAFFPAAARLSYKPTDRPGRIRLLALCWAAFVLVFFSFSTSQEYYTMPCYPAFALLIGSAVAEGGSWVRRGARAVSLMAGTAFLAVVALLFGVRNVETPGDISTALTQNPDSYTLSLGHMQDLTLSSFAYLRMPLVLAGVALLVGAIGCWQRRELYRFGSMVLMMVLFFQAARVALVAFDPYFSSRQLAETLLRAPPGTFIADDEYYSFSSIFFYANRDGLLLNGRKNNLEYGSNEPGAPAVFIDDAEFAARWQSEKRHYLATFVDQRARFEKLAGKQKLFPLLESGGKLLFTNRTFQIPERN